jgi:proton-translocating NADH-quinone oxidoreductase chain L
MSTLDIIFMYLLIILFPLLGFFASAIFGRFLGFRGGAILTTTSIFFSFFCSCFALFEVAFCQTVVTIKLFPWFTTELFDCSWGFLFDPLTVVMCFVVTSISFLVHIYSIEYMYGDPHSPRFMSYLSIFTFFMVMLVTSDNFLQMFFGWEGVGCASYLLINFWFTRLQASKASIKAMLVNRVGDIGLAIAIMTIFSIFGSVEFSVVFPLVPYIATLQPADTGFVFCNMETFSPCETIGILLFIGSIGKSAQCGLHTWLPDAMEGPTPVSALIHAATMVTAGVFLLCRCSPLFEYAPQATLIVAFVGGITCIFAASIAVVQNDYKRIIAYSTCSQLGYMVFACGISQYPLAVFHLVNHAFFKALLFLTGGSVIHAVSDEQDIRKMGGYAQILPFTNGMMIIGTLSLAGFPFLTGFFSKDSILENSYAQYTGVANFIFWSATFTVFLTSFYSFRLYFASFISDYKGFFHPLRNCSEPAFCMTIPLFLLAIGSIFAGYCQKDMMIGAGTDFWGSALFILPNHAGIQSEFIPQSARLAPLIATIFGWGGALYLYRKGIFGMETIHQIDSQKGINFLFFTGTIQKYILYTLSKRWFLDKIINNYIISKSLNFGYIISFKTLDKGVFELLGPYGIGCTMKKITETVSNLQTGYLYHYAVLMLFGSIFFILFISLWDYLQYFIDSRLYLIFLFTFFTSTLPSDQH